MNHQAVLATRKFLSDEEGVTAIEYALVATSLAVAVIATVYLLGQQVHSFYLHVLDCIQRPSTCVA